jgi:hypothetical protein
VFKVVLNLESKASVHSSATAASLGPADKGGWAQSGAGDAFADTHGGAGVYSPYQGMVRNGHSPVTNFPNESTLVVRGLTVRYQWKEPDAPQPEWRLLRHRVAKLVEWLATPPTKRAASPNV